MKWLVMILICLISAQAYAFKGNASCVTVELINIASRGIVFSPPTRDLNIRNNDADDYIWVDLKSSIHGIDGFFDYAKCMLIAPGDDVTLYDFLTDGITIIKDPGTYGSSVGASPVSVESIF